MEIEFILPDQFKHINVIDLKADEIDWEELDSEKLTPEELEVRSQMLIDKYVAQGRAERDNDIMITLMIWAAIVIFAPIYVYMKLPKWREEYPLNFNEYIEKYPQCFSNGEVTCCKCGSNKQSNFIFSKGWFGNHARSVNCHTCGAHLYRIEND